MIRRKQDQEIIITENVVGGVGKVINNVLLSAKNDEFYGKGRTFSRYTLKPGCSVGFHMHNNELECFYILKGNPEYDDNGQKTVLNPGDASITFSGEGHAIANPEGAASDVEFIALILFK